MTVRVTRKLQAFPFAHERYQFYRRLEVHIEKKHEVTLVYSMFETYLSQLLKLRRFLCVSALKRPFLSANLAIFQREGAWLERCSHRRVLAAALIFAKHNLELVHPLLPRFKSNSICPVPLQEGGTHLRRCNHQR